MGGTYCFLKNTGSMIIFKNTTGCLYFLFVQQWTCHFKRFCCSVHYSSHGKVDAILFIFTKLWQHIFQDAYFEKELQTNSLFKTHLSYNDQLPCMKHSTWLSSSLTFQHWCEEEIPAALSWLNELRYSLWFGTWLMECSVFTFLSKSINSWIK